MSRPEFMVVEREVKRPVDAGGLRLEVKADRIDELSSGGYVILDYKTSDKPSLKDWDGDRPDAPQLPLYAVKSERQVSGVYFAKLVPHQIALLGYGADELAQCLPEWTRVVDQLGASFLRGDAAVNPKNAAKTCALCDLHSLCRIADIRNSGEPEDQAGE